MTLGRIIAERFHLEVAAWAAIAVTAWAISAHYSVFEFIVAFSRRHERWQVDEAFTLIIVVSVTSFAASLVKSRHHLKSRREAEREAFFAARRDVLTNLPNRRMFTELAGNALGEAWRKNGRCAVLFIDLDGFKPVNDTYGHAAGDELLVAFADLLRDEAPPSALPARLGGDEFAILLPDVFDEATAVSLAGKIQESMQQRLRISGGEVSVGATIGIALGPENGRRAEDLIHAADMAMYEAKRERRGTVRVFRQSEKQVSARIPADVDSPSPQRLGRSATSPELSEPEQRDRPGGSKHCSNQSRSGALPIRHQERWHEVR